LTLDREVWTCPLKDGIAVILFNRGLTAGKISFDFTDVGYD